MRVFAVYDAENACASDGKKALAYLFYYEKSKKFIIELPSDADERFLPFPLGSFAKRKELTVPESWSEMWVNNRIDSSLEYLNSKECNITVAKRTDDFKKMLAVNGHSMRDSFYIEEVEKENVDEEIYIRIGTHIDSFTLLDGYKILVQFAGGKIGICDFEQFNKGDNSYRSVFDENPELYERASLSLGGYEIVWNHSMKITSAALYEKCTMLPIDVSEFREIILKSTVNTQEAALLLDCSRQNIDDLVKRGKITPIKASEKNMIFDKGDIIRRGWLV